ncbi:TPA: YeaC family protein, partial [Acinetobacter nosocomialis]
MNIEQMLSVLNPEIVERLKTAVEIGKWPNGVVLTKEQRETCMQAVIAWELKNLPEEQRSGYI